MNRVSKITLASVFIILMLTTASIAVAKDQIDKQKQKSTQSFGLTDIQIQKWGVIQKQMISNMTSNITSNITKLGNQSDKSIAYQYIGGNNGLYQQVCCIEDQYLIYDGYTQIPIKVEVWNNTLAPLYRSDVMLSIFYWDDISLDWKEYQGQTKKTNTAGQVKFGVSIPIYHRADTWSVDIVAFWPGSITKHQQYTKYFYIARADY